MSFNPGPDAANPYLAQPPGPNANPNPYTANPYAAPVAGFPGDPAALGGAPDEIRLDAALYTSGHVSLATFLGSPLGGAAIMAINEHRAGRSGTAVKTMLAGVVGTAFLLGIGFVLPNGVPTFPVGLLSLLLMGWIAKQRQGQLVHRHFARGGRRASGWAAAGIGVLCTIVIFVPLVAVLVLIEMARGSG